MVAGMEGLTIGISSLSVESSTSSIEVASSPLSLKNQSSLSSQASCSPPSPSPKLAHVPAGNAACRAERLLWAIHRAVREQRRRSSRPCKERKWRRDTKVPATSTTPRSLRAMAANYFDIQMTLTEKNVQLSSWSGNFMEKERRRKEMLLSA